MNNLNNLWKNYNENLVCVCVCVNGVLINFNYISTKFLLHNLKQIQVSKQKE